VRLPTCICLLPRLPGSLQKPPTSHLHSTTPTRPHLDSLFPVQSSSPCASNIIVVIRADARSTQSLPRYALTGRRCRPLALALAANHLSNSQCNAGRRLSQQPYVLVRSDSKSSSGSSSPTDRKPPVYPTVPAHGRSQSLGSARCVPVREGASSLSKCPSHSSAGSHLSFAFPCRSHEDDAQHSD